MAIESSYRVYCDVCRRYLKAPKQAGPGPGTLVRDASEATEYDSWILAVADSRKCFRGDGTHCEDCWLQYAD